MSTSSNSPGLQGGKKSFTDVVRHGQSSKNADSLTIVRGLLTIRTEGFQICGNIFKKISSVVYIYGELFSKSKIFFFPS